MKHKRQRPWTDNPLWAALVLFLVLGLILPQVFRWNQGNKVQQLLEKGRQAYHQRQDPQKALEALTLFDRAYALSPGWGDVRREWLRAYFFRAQWQPQSTKWLYQSLDVANEGSSYFGQTVLYLVEGFIIFARDIPSSHRADFALTWAERILRNREQLDIYLNAQHYYLWGRLYLLRQEPQKAVESLSQALQRNQQSLKNRFWLAKTYLQMGQKEEAAKLFQDLIHREVYYEPLVEAGQYKQAAEDCLQKGEYQCGAL